jgi:hypothetical protein
VRENVFRELSNTSGLYRRFATRNYQFTRDLPPIFSPRIMRLSPDLSPQTQLL